MIQELLGGSSVGLINGGERSSSKISAPANCGGNIVDGSSSHSPSPSPSPSSSSAASASVAAAPENLRCPRCDSSNTKFCYYNNYNLTQPRHFCKTCRRYWTKGGALRNVPIGGGCRKNKNSNITAAVAKSNATAKFKAAPAEMGKTGIFGGFEHGDAISSNPILWASPQNSHLLSIFRANQNQNHIQNHNPNPNPNHLPNPVKEEGSVFGSSHFNSEPPIRVLGLDPLGPTLLPSMGMPNSYYRNQTQSSQGFIHGDHHQVQNNNGFQELYQRLRSSTSCYPDHTPVILGNFASAINSASSTPSAILESAPVATGELGFWNNPSLPWPMDLSTTNGAYP